MKLYYLRKPCRDLLIIVDRVHKRASIKTCGYNMDLPVASDKSQAKSILKRYFAYEKSDYKWHLSVEQAEILLTVGKRRILAEYTR